MTFDEWWNKHRLDDFGSWRELTRCAYRAGYDEADQKVVRENEDAGGVTVIIPPDVVEALNDLHED